MSKHYYFSKTTGLLAFFLLASFVLGAAETVPLSTLDLSKMKQGWGEPKIDQSVTGKPLTIGGKTFEHGVGTHAQSMLYVQLDGGTSRFTAKVGVDDSQKGTAGVGRVSRYRRRKNALQKRRDEARRRGQNGRCRSTRREDLAVVRRFGRRRNQ